MLRYMAFIAGVLLAALTACNNAAEGRKTEADTAAVLTRVHADTTDRSLPATGITADQIMDSLRRIPFVAERAHFIDSFSNHQQGLAFLLDTVSGKEVNFRVGYNGVERFETYYIFVVDPQTFDIKIVEPVSGDAMTIAEYQQVPQK
ncbi:hypothetical protein [Niabella aurantiaca]|uniref:hypothetical protein n=1 Tax=Niabella aurantiaca TaxID=379900 RepID=UPI000379811C|nr:hypothetical protein [Niabella aurantiaca]